MRRFDRFGLLLAMVVVVLFAGACSGWTMLDRGLEHLTEWRETRVDKQERGWKAPDGGFFVCDEKPKFDVTLEGRKCARLLAPTMAECQAGFGMLYVFEDTLSGMARQGLFPICVEAAYGQKFRHLDGIYRAGDRVVLDANAGATNP